MGKRYKGTATDTCIVVGSSGHYGEKKASSKAHIAMMPLTTFWKGQNDRWTAGQWLQGGMLEGRKAGATTEEQHRGDSEGLVPLMES